jgi:hypothetical protein
MNSQTMALRVAGTIFALICVLQAWRYLAGVEVVAAGHEIPVWISGIAAIVLGALAFWMYRVAMPGEHHST